MSAQANPNHPAPPPGQPAAAAPQPVPIHPSAAAPAHVAPPKDKRVLRRVLMLGGILVVLGATTVAYLSRRPLCRHGRCVHQIRAAERHDRRVGNGEVGRGPRRPARRGGRRVVPARPRTVRNRARQCEGDAAAGRNDRGFAEGRLSRRDSAGQRATGDDGRRQDDARPLRGARQTGLDRAHAMGPAAGDVSVALRPR